jgi:hypothetical protein
MQLSDENAGTRSQELKTSDLVAGTPRDQQIATLVGAGASALRRLIYYAGVSTLVITYYIVLVFFYYPPKYVSRLLLYTAGLIGNLQKELFKSSFGSA